MADADKKEVVVHKGKVKEEYANLVALNSNESEFVVDFGRIYPEGNEGELVARIAMPPKIARNLRDMLSEALGEQEKRD